MLLREDEVEEGRYYLVVPPKMYATCTHRVDDVVGN